MSELGKHLTGGWRSMLGTEKEFKKSREKTSMARKMKIKEALKKSSGTMHVGKKGAPGISSEDLTPKEKHYREDSLERARKNIKSRGF